MQPGELHQDCHQSLSALHQAYIPLCPVCTAPSWLHQTGHLQICTRASTSFGCTRPVHFFAAPDTPPVLAAPDWSAPIPGYTRVPTSPAKPSLDVTQIINYLDSLAGRPPTKPIIVPGMESLLWWLNDGLSTTYHTSNRIWTNKEKILIPWKLSTC